MKKKEKERKKFTCHQRQQLRPQQEQPQTAAVAVKVPGGLATGTHENRLTFGNEVLFNIFGKIA